MPVCTWVWAWVRAYDGVFGFVISGSAYFMSELTNMCIIQRDIVESLKATSVPSVLRHPGSLDSDDAEVQKEHRVPTSYLGKNLVMSLVDAK